MVPEKLGLRVISLILLCFTTSFSWQIIPGDPSTPHWHLLYEQLLRQDDKNLPPYFLPLPLKWTEENYTIIGKERNEKGLGFDVMPFLSWYHTTPPYPGIILGAGYEANSYAFYTSYRIDKELLRNPAYSGKRWQGVAGEGEIITIGVRPCEDLYLSLIHI